MSKQPEEIEKFEKYGLRWKKGWSNPDIEAYCFVKKRPKKRGGLGTFGHFKAMAEWVYPQMQWDEWMEDRIEALCDYDFNSWTGCGASGKTFSAGLFAVLWWAVEPKRSTVVLTSTTGKMVRKRIWPVIQDLYYSSKKSGLQKTWAFSNGVVGNLVDSKTTLQASKGDDKNGIFAMAVKQGSTASAVADIQGLHNERMLIIIDEATDTPEAIFEAITNLRKGCSEFKLLVIGNPVSHMDPHGKCCEPANGWGSINIDFDRWDTKGVPDWDIDPGICLHFDGTKSPNIIGGVNKYPYLINSSDVERAKRDGLGEKTINFWKFTRGFWPPEGICNTIFTESMVEKYDGKGKHIFYQTSTPIAALDPAFGGDRCILKFGKYGDLNASRKMGVQLTETLEIVTDPTLKTPVDHQIADRVIAECKARGVAPDFFAMDSTGTGRGVAAILQMQWGEINKCEFGGAPSDKPASIADPRPAYEVYDRKVTELWYSCQEFLISGQLKGLSNDEVIEFCGREFTNEKRKFVLDTKADCKAKIGRSPDHADAVAVLVDLCRKKGVTAEGLSTESKEDKIFRIAQKMHSVYDDEDDSVNNNIADEPTFSQSE